MDTGRRGFRSSTIVPGPAPYFRPYSRNDDGVTKYIPCSREMLDAQLSIERRQKSCPSLYRGVRRLPSPVSPTRSFRQRLDTRLCALNADYKQYRAGDYGLQGPMVEAVAPSGFAAWMKSRGKLGGQHKVPRIINNAELFASLREFARLAS
jgi:GH3 auxin-responsive promoter